jgi:peptidoglycan hydrolase CwlO-like protein
MVTILILLFLTDIGLGFVVWNLLRKLETADDDFEEMEKQYTETQKVIQLMDEKIQNSMEKMKSLDRIGAFQADDETGYVFKEMYSIIEELDKYYGETKEEPIN